MRFLPLSFGVLALLAAARSGYGQSDASLSDPTRPPPVAIESAPASKEDIPPPSGLQTIIIGRGHRPMAVINGTTVELGDKVGDARLVKIGETQVVLQGPGGREVLYLTPGVEKMGGLPQKRSSGADQRLNRAAARARPDGATSDDTNHDK